MPIQCFGQGFKDMTGQVFSRLTVLRRGRNYRRQAGWVCRCECGNTVTVMGSKLRNGHTRSCGCLKVELAVNREATHRLSKRPEYRVWQSMKRRCHAPTARDYADYGARGVTVCQQWRNSFEQFWQDMGPRPTPKHSLDRKDANGDYCPANCRWATSTEQARNKRTTRTIELRGERRPLKEWCEILGINYYTAHKRLSNGHDPETVLSTTMLGNRAPR